MIQSKLPDIGTTIFTVMSQLSAENNAINLGQGFPEFNPDEKLIELVNQAMKEGHNQYPYMPGVAPLREEIAIKVKDLYGASYDPLSEITVTNGATEAIMATILATVHTGDEVIVIEPCYDSYVPSIRLAGGTPVYVALTPPNDQNASFTIDWEKVEKSITPKTKLLILNFPHNPTGITLEKEDLDTIEQILSRHSIFILADEVYEHIVFDNKPFLSLSSRPAIAERAFIISSFGKTYHTTGWKVGYCCAPAALTKEFRKIHQFIVFTVCSPMQYALAEYMKDKSTYMGLSQFYQQKHDLLFNGLAKTNFKPIKSAGTFFLLANYSTISNKDEYTFVSDLTREYKVGLIPVSAFYRNPNSPEANNHLVRFCFAKYNDTLNNALSRISDI
ncbi:methionine aminotransferase [Pelistega europaea]|uniref:Aminotransferase class I/II-fold pyridoxal phosphate-dependent enzyme n=1 Tax=Pelistega europaea TaxID=106147 RepID=A0A7Y4LBL3_9BURK|nr:methionine aminotransferase [Pelistega europaea]NOL50538.1 aminotransferase class I/II-fold pyridoxal phosphate-dependent enzyme [Pelistega europaea]